MKKILWLCPLMLLMMAFIGCDTKKKTMTKVWVVNYQKPHGQQK